MIRFKMLAVLLLLLLVTGGCASVKVSQDYDLETIFGDDRSWQWRNPIQPPTGDIRVDNPLLDRRIRMAVENHLKGRTYQLVKNDPDLLFSYHLVVERKIFSDTYSSSYGVGAYRYPWYWDVGVQTRVYQYDQNRLTIDIHQADTRRLLWRGEGVFLLKTYKTPQAAAEAMQDTVDQILNQFPPGR